MQERDKYLDLWAQSILANPLTKSACTVDDFVFIDGVADARIYLKNTYGYAEWSDGQDVYEAWESSGEGYQNEVALYKKEILIDRPVYERFLLSGTVLDIGGGVGTVREFLPSGCHFISIDPFIKAPYKIASSKLAAYKCLSHPLNFISGVAEFLPFQGEKFDWVHMRSMLDHVQVPDLALLEAHRVLKKDGSILVGMSIEGGKLGKRSPLRFLKDLTKEILGFMGFEKLKDHHTWHPTFNNLQKMIQDNGFKIIDVYWQPHWNDQVVYIHGIKA